MHMNCAEAKAWVDKMRGYNDGMSRLFEPVRPEDVMVVETLLDGASHFAKEPSDLYTWVNRVSRLFSEVQHEPYSNE